MNKYFPFLVLIFLLGLIALATYNLNKQQDVKKSENNEDFGVHFVKSEIALPDFSLPNLDSDQEAFSKKDLGKKKYSLVNFFASWCSTCHAEHQILLRLKKSGILDMYGVAWHDISENTHNYLATSGNPFDKVAVDSKGVLGNEARIEAIPETWLVDQDGVIRFRFRGNLQDFSVEEIQRIVLE
ncbi:MAG: redoxin family protein [Proteobacteria bacterium]|nr:redoxin family protein [Pseudomonadota bacterium]